MPAAATSLKPKQSVVVFKTPFRIRSNIARMSCSETGEESLFRKVINYDFLIGHLNAYAPTMAFDMPYCTTPIDVRRALGGIEN